jgi:dolichyl-phosphate-mannose-protein mannosyltransferase
VTGALLEFIFNSETIVDESPAGKSGKKNASAPRRFVSARERFVGQSMLPAWIGTAVLLLLVACSWYFFLPLTYGYPGLSVDQVLMRKWLGYDLHFAK